MLFARDLRRPPSDLRFLFALGVQSGAIDQMLFDDFKDDTRDEGDRDDSIRRKMETIIGRLRSIMHPFTIEGLCSSTSYEGLSLSLAMLASEQAAVATEIISAVQQNTKKLMFLQGSAGTGKTHTFRVILSELHRLGIRCLVSATTGIAAVQYPQGKLFILCFASVSMSPILRISYHMSVAGPRMLPIYCPLV
jgi:hypothetical protein